MAKDWTIAEIEKLYSIFRPVASSNRGKSLLIADSDDSVRTIVSGQMQQKGFTVWSAADALETLKILKSHKPDCCLLDMNLQPVSGLDILEAISRDEEGGQMVVFITSNLNPREERTLAQIYGAVDFLKKPVQTTALAQRIAQIFTDREPQSNPG